MNERECGDVTRIRRYGMMWVILILAVCITTMTTACSASMRGTADETDVAETAGESYTEELADGTDQENLGTVRAGNLNWTGYDVVYVIDNSRSVWSQQEYRNQAFKNISNLTVGSDIRIGVVYFADHVYGTLSLTSMKTENGSSTVLDFLNMTDQDDGNRDTNIGEALKAAIALFDDQDPAREKIVVLFSDGINENLSGDESYKEKADAETEEQVGILREMDIPVYCVYLQKDRNDEAYLRNLVNYFSDDADYTDERFKKVTEEEISLLSAAFTDVFYSMQNNMKYRQISLDSTGSFPFYVPSLGITSLRIYLEGDLQEGTNVIPAGESDHEKWTDGSAAFLIYENPAPGDWQIHVVSPDLDAVYGTIAYYTDLQATASLIRGDENTGSYQLAVAFETGDGQEISVDPAANILATVHFTGEDGTTDAFDLSMTVLEGTAVSDSFTMKGYGRYSYEINLTYGGFVDLSYTFSGTSIERSAPVTTDIAKEYFWGERTEQGIQFSIQESTLFTDPQGEAVTVTDVVLLNGDNPVSVSQAGGYLVVTAENTGSIGFVLQLADASGMEAKVTVQGTVIDQEIVRMAIQAVIAMGATAAMIAVLLILVRRFRKGILEERMDAFEQIAGEFDTAEKQCREEISQADRNREDLDAYLHGDADNPELTGLVEMAAALTGEQLEMFGVAEYLADGYEETQFAAIERIRTDLDAAGEMMSSLRKRAKTQARRSNQEKGRAGIKVIEGICGTAKGQLRAAQKLLGEMKEENSRIAATLDGIAETGGTVYEILETEVHCDLTVKSISTLPNARGTMAARNIGGTKVKGYYRLDDIQLLGGKGKLGSEANLGATGIYVYGYQDEDRGETGLWLRSKNQFALRDPDGNMLRATEARLLRGNVYELTVLTRTGETSMKLAVR